MQTPIHAKYRFDIAQFKRANRAFRRQQIGLKIRIAAIMVCLGAATMGFGYAKGGDIKNALLFIGIPLYLWTLLFIRRLLSLRRFNRSPGKDAEIEWIFSTEEISMSTSDGSSAKIKWPHITSAIQFADGILIGTHPQIFQWIPSEGVMHPDTFSDLCGLVRVHAKSFKVR
jgi:hypothetical protein